MIITDSAVVLRVPLSLRLPPRPPFAGPVRLIRSWPIDRALIVYQQNRQRHWGYKTLLVIGGRQTAKLRPSNNDERAAAAELRKRRLT